MKIIICSLAIVLSLTTSASENINCTSDDSIWQVTLEIDEKEARNIEFYKEGKLVTSISHAEVDIYRFPWKVLNYEVNLGGFKYLSIERKVRKKMSQPTGTAVFLLKNNPFGLEQKIEHCEFSSI